MKLIFFLTVIASLSSYSTGLGQTVNLHLKDSRIETAFSSIRKETGYRFIYKESLLEQANKVSINVKNEQLETVLQMLLKNQPLDFEIYEGTVVIKEKSFKGLDFLKESTKELVNEIQQRIIQGKVTDEDGKPLEGVSVTLKGLSTGTSTNVNGIYSLSITEGQNVLVFSMIGFIAQEVKITQQNTINITLKSQVSSLDDVVIIGYGTARKRDLTGAISSVKFDEKEAAQISSVDKLLQGRAAGVMVNTGSAAPGGAVNVRIRGINSFSGGNEPLYVVDGVIISTSTQDVGNSLTAGTNPGNSSQEAQSGLTAINPQDIESIEVLKDASATAIYGSRGANGVVLITTKKGNSDKGAISFSSTTDFARVSKKMPVLDGYTFAEYWNKSSSLQGLTSFYDMKTIQPVNWQDDIFRTGITTNNRVTFSGKKDKSSYFLALGHLNNDGIIPNTGLKQGDFRFNLVQEITNKLKISSRTGLTLRRNSMTQSTEQMGSASNSIIRQMLFKQPIRDTVDLSNPSFLEIDESHEGPRAWLQEYDDISNEFRILQSLSLEYKLNKAFTLRVLGGADIRNKDRHRWFGKVLGQGRNTNGQLGYSNLKSYNYNLEGLLLYSKKSGNHRINATTGLTYDNSYRENSYTANEDFFSEELRIHGLGTGARVFPFVESFSKTAILSALARVIYSYQNKYVLTVTGRADGTSLFAEGNKWGFFPSLAFSWSASDEDFIKNLNVFSLLKPRVGYGITGNQAISPYETITRYKAAYYSANNGTVLVGANPALIANRDLTWESTNQINLGVDIGFFKDRLVVTADIYNKKTKDLLQQTSLPTSTGFSTMYLNRGAIENKGMEFAVTGILSEKQLKWTVNANISFNRNKIVDIGLPESKFGNMDLSAFLGRNVSGGEDFKVPANIFAENYPVGMFFGYQTKGIYQAEDVINNPLKLSGTPLQAGDIYFVDQNGDGNINEADKVIIGNPNPKFGYGFSTNFSYNQFSLGIFINGVYGNQIANGNRLKLENTQGRAYGSNIIDYAYNLAWTTEHPENPYPRLLYRNGDFTDRILEDGSYLRIGMVTLGYRPELKNIGFIRALDLFVSGKNLLTITKYTGYDPEVNSFTYDPLRIGIDWSSYPNTRSIAIGINATF